jgi:DNA polymerase III subunit epsilon
MISRRNLMCGLLISPIVGVTAPARGALFPATGRTSCPMRQVVLDTETTGIGTNWGHRIVEIGCIELCNQRLTGRYFQRYLNPERNVDEAARAVHGLSRAQLLLEPKFADVASEFLEFIEGSELIIHNAPFDTGFLEYEWALIGTPLRVHDVCPVIDTLTLARERHPGQRNNLAVLCKRYGIEKSHPELHGALLDARITADVYLAMTGGSRRDKIVGSG